MWQKPKVLISCAVTAQLICGFVFAYANCCFSHAADHIHIYENYFFGIRLAITYRAGAKYFELVSVMMIINTL